MRTELRQSICAPPEVVFELASRVEDWPRLLPHYGLVHVLQSLGNARVVEMAAHRPVVGSVGIPLRWRAVQWVDAAERRITFLHVAGPTRGMFVEWQLTASADGCTEVRLRHTFDPPWPVPNWMIHAVVGEYFVHGVARQTLRTLTQVCVH